jgi:hypothetical protein
LEVLPPPNVTDFDDEIPELPDLDFPEELSREKSFSPPEPQPKSPVVPPPQGQTTQRKAITPIGSVNFGTPEEGGSDNIRFEKIETPKLKRPIAKPVEAAPFSKENTFFSGGQEYIREAAFVEIVHGLKQIEEMVANSRRFETLMEMDIQKQKAVKEFQKEVKGALSALDEIDRIAFPR